jgi:hypothetical protein
MNFSRTMSTRRAEPARRSLTRGQHSAPSLQTGPSRLIRRIHELVDPRSGGQPLARRQLLTNEERRALFGFPVDPDGLTRCFTLSQFDRQLVVDRRNDTSRLGYAVQLASCCVTQVQRLPISGPPVDSLSLTLNLPKLGRLTPSPLAASTVDQFGSFQFARPSRYRWAAKDRTRIDFIICQIICLNGYVRPSLARLCRRRYDQCSISSKYPVRRSKKKAVFPLQVRIRQLRVIPPCLLTTLRMNKSLRHPGAWFMGSRLLWCSG